MKCAAIAGLTFALAASPSLAQDLAFRAALQGEHAPSATGSPARGDARIRVHTETQTVDLLLDVRGIGLDDLSTPLKATPIGPIHLHLYGGRDHTDPNASVKLIFAAPFGEAYRATPQGFHLELTGSSYTKSAATLRSTVSFGDFVRALQEGAVVVNIHTNAWPDGEISGDIIPANT